MQAQCWFCPTCFDDSAHEQPCKRALWVKDLTKATPEQISAYISLLGKVYRLLRNMPGWRISKIEITNERRMDMHFTNQLSAEVILELEHEPGITRKFFTYVIYDA